jgi:3-hydroxyacyl-CoA dehydrogenase
MARQLGAADATVAVFGAGTMGRGIAQVCAQAGLTTFLADARGRGGRGDWRHR